MRRPLVAGNWKMHGSRAMDSALVGEIAASLPAGADEDDIKATYDKGILSVSVGVSKPASAEKHVEISAK